MIGYELVRSFDDLFAEAGPGMGPFLILWMLALFLSILIHELGHALAFRQQGIQSAIVLYHFGGLAVPIASLIPGRSIGRLTAKQNLWISFAGPLAQLSAAAVVAFGLKASGFKVAAMSAVPFVGERLMEFFDGELIANPALFALSYFFIYPSILWALLNLLPVLPLDGGRIMQAIVSLTGGDQSQAYWISVGTGGLLAAYALTHGQTFMGIFFAMFAVQSFQMLQQRGGWR